MSNRTIELNLTGGILLLFFVFWWQSGWYRVDCALGIQKACDLIASEKDYQPPARSQ